jgi:hypothetical protein
VAIGSTVTVSEGTAVSVTSGAAVSVAVSVGTSVGVGVSVEAGVSVLSAATVVSVAVVVGSGVLPSSACTGLTTIKASTSARMIPGMIRILLVNVRITTLPDTIIVFGSLFLLLPAMLSRPYRGDDLLNAHYNPNLIRLWSSPVITNIRYPARVQKFPLDKRPKNALKCNRLLKPVT